MLDPSFPNTLYAGTDIGTFVTPTAALVEPPRHGDAEGCRLAARLRLHRRLLLDGTHGRGAYTLSDGTAAPALVVSKTRRGCPVGPGSDLDYTVTVRNVGNAAATGVSVDRPGPGAHDLRLGRPTAGRLGRARSVTWDGLTVPAGGSV